MKRCFDAEEAVAVVAGACGEKQGALLRRALETDVQAAKRVRRAVGWLEDEVRLADADPHPVHCNAVTQVQVETAGIIEDVPGGGAKLLRIHIRLQPTATERHGAADYEPVALRRLIQLVRVMLWYPGEEDAHTAVPDPIDGEGELHSVKVFEHRPSGDGHVLELQYNIREEDPLPRAVRVEMTPQDGGDGDGRLYTLRLRYAALGKALHAAHGLHAASPAAWIGSTRDEIYAAASQSNADGADATLNLSKMWQEELGWEGAACPLLDLLRAVDDRIAPLGAFPYQLELHEGSVSKCSVSRACRILLPRALDPAQWRGADITEAHRASDAKIAELVAQAKEWRARAALYRKLGGEGVREAVRDMAVSQARDLATLTRRDGAQCRKAEVAGGAKLFASPVGEEAARRVVERHDLAALRKLLLQPTPKKN
eukprot:TRINITY_DN18275_c0_g1_i2.p1 TRINITY_DN18275_c0_g1~~TRINITY_DN18275_c0_g1_i2.p1  ORF type:complete len:428 (+),score=92.15 TRINITY_DN18275_c0_g1_i2:88-1371(+)